MSTCVLQPGSPSCAQGSPGSAQDDEGSPLDPADDLRCGLFSLAPTPAGPLGARHACFSQALLQQPQVCCWRPFTWHSSRPPRIGLVPCEACNPCCGSVHAGVCQVSCVDGGAPASAGPDGQAGHSRIRWRYPHARRVCCALVRFPLARLGACGLQLAHFRADTGALVHVPAALRGGDSEPLCTLLTVQVRSDTPVTGVLQPAALQCTHAHYCGHAWPAPLPDAQLAPARGTRRQRRNGS